jgi:hypothetical protein
MKHSSAIKIGVHVRLGDSSGREHVEAKLPQYFKQVMSFYRTRHPEAVFIICSQDYGWVKKHMAVADGEDGIHFCPSYHTTEAGAAKKPTVFMTVGAKPEKIKV